MNRAQRVVAATTCFLLALLLCWTFAAGPLLEQRRDPSNVDRWAFGQPAVYYLHPVGQVLPGVALPVLLLACGLFVALGRRSES